VTDFTFPSMKRF